MWVSKGYYSIAVLVLVLSCNSVNAQQPAAQQQPPTLPSLIAQGFEIKAATYNGGQGTSDVYLQKGKDVFVCRSFQNETAQSACHLEHFPEKWIPVFRKKMRQIKTLRAFSDSTKSEIALVN